ATTSSGGDGKASGLLKSTNGGLTWTVLGEADFGSKNLVITAVLPTRLTGGQVILVATRGNVMDSGIYRSADGGMNWVKVSGIGGANLLPAGSVTDLVADPEHVNRFYAGVVGQEAVFRSDDGGVN